MLSLATLAVVASTLVAGACLASAPSGTSRPVRLQILCALWPLVAGLMVHELARFASNVNADGGDITSQLLMEGLAFLQLPLLGLGALTGALIRASTDAPPIAVAPATAPLDLPLRAGPILERRALAAARPLKIAGIVLAGVMGALLLLGAIEGVRKLNAASSYPRALAGHGSSLPGVDYGPDVATAAAAAPLPILWLGPQSSGHELSDVTLTQRSVDYPTFEPQAIANYGERGEIQVSEALADSNGQNDQFMTGPSVTVHGTTFWLGEAGMALGKIRGRDITIQAPAATPAQWRPILYSLHWVCAPALPRCSGW
jgi:hypothetical protein